MSSAFAPLRESSAAQRRTLLAASLGWALDAFDVMLYALVLAHIMRDLGISKGTAGLLNTLTLLASGIGGILFGFIADRALSRHQILIYARRRAAGDSVWWSVVAGSHSVELPNRKV